MDWTGRQIKRDKRGAIPQHLAQILERIGIAQRHWLPVVENFGRHFHRVAGAPQSVGRIKPRLGRQRSFHPGRAELLAAT